MNEQEKQIDRAFSLFEDTYERKEGTKVHLLMKDRWVIQGVICKLPTRLISHTRLTHGSFFVWGTAYGIPSGCEYTQIEEDATQNSASNPTRHDGLFLVRSGDVISFCYQPEQHTSAS